MGVGSDAEGWRGRLGQARSWQVTREEKKRQKDQEKLEKMKNRNVFNPKMDRVDPKEPTELQKSLRFR